MWFSEIWCLSVIELLCRTNGYSDFHVGKQFLLVAGAYFLSHSLSWSNDKENGGIYAKKVWVPEDPRSAKANGRYPTEGWWRKTREICPEQSAVTSAIFINTIRCM